jgi:hypothetical protein
MKKFVLLLVVILIGFNSFAQDKLYLLFEFMKVDNEQESDYRETESFWEKIHEQRVKNGDIIGWDLWSLQPGGENQGFQYLTVNLYDDPVKMFEGSGDFMKAVKAAYPDLSEEDLQKKFNITAKSRDLAVRIYLEEIATTKDDFEITIGTVASIDMMKVEFGKSGAYEKAEKEVFQPMHQKQVDAGAKGSWGLLRFMSPVGSETYASHITVNMYKDYSHLFGENMAYDGPTLTEEQIKTVQEGISTRDMKYVDTANLIKMAR